MWVCCEAGTRSPMAAVLSLAEIRARAIAFAQEWKDERREAAEKQTFWNEFFGVFGIHRRRVASFEVPVALRDGRHGAIDLFWPGTLLVEHKSRGLDLTAAFRQAADYFSGIRDEDLPKFVIVSDFGRFRVYNLDEREQTEFPLAHLPRHIATFGFLTGHTVKPLPDAPHVNVKAAGLMAELHDQLRQNGYAGHPLAVLLVRLMFCMFADRTGLWATGLFRQIIDRQSSEDGRTLGRLLSEVFVVLDTPETERQRNLDEDLGALPYVNGRLFSERIDPPAFDLVSRRTLLRCCAFDWSAVSPAIFGAMFQGVMDEERGRRRQVGAHYTSERNILKALGPLLLDPLREELRRARGAAALRALLARISRIAILDPACGCGNFLIVAFRELRQMEIEIHRRLQRPARAGGGRFLSIDFTRGIGIDAMCGIEIEEFPVRVAETALYLTDHIMNMRAEEEFGQNFVKLPLSRAPNIVRGNALRLNWSDVVPIGRLTCVVGNPPFIGKKARSAEQVEDMSLVFGDWPKAGELDYVSAWYVKAIEFVRGTDVPVAFVSTNSVTQGEQVSILWPKLRASGLGIRFAHRTFRWDNDAPGEASVFCVIIGWAWSQDTEESSRRPHRALLFDYDTPSGEPHVVEVARINPYLVDHEDVFVSPRREPLFPAPVATFGNMPNDDGNFLFSEAEYDQFLTSEAGARELFRPFASAREVLYGKARYCLWLKDAAPAALRSLPLVRERIDRVRAFRAASSREATRRLANTPALFGEIRQPTSAYVWIPRHSSETRRYIPIAFMPVTTIVADSCIAVHSDDRYVFGVLQSTMHMAWMRQVCGRLESRYRYSVELVYNCFPWPTGPSPRLQQGVREAAGAVLKARAAVSGQALADLYDAAVMPPALQAAHRDLDRAVDRCYRGRRFEGELARVRYLLEAYTVRVRGGQLPMADARTRPIRRQGRANS